MSACATHQCVWVSCFSVFSVCAVPKEARSLPTGVTGSFLPSYGYMEWNPLKARSCQALPRAPRIFSIPCCKQLDGFIVFVHRRKLVQLRGSDHLKLLSLSTFLTQALSETGARQLTRLCRLPSYLPRPGTTQQEAWVLEFELVLA